MTKFSVILPAYNAEPFIRQTIQSILDQTFGDFEIIVVDDGSSDATAEIAAEMDPRVSVIKQRNQGIALARNTGLAAAKGEWIAFMDHDDLWHPQKLAVQASLLEQRPECGIVFGEFLRWDPATPPAFPVQELDVDCIAEDLSGYILHRLVQTNWVLLTTAVVRRKVFDAVGLFDPAMPPADDWDFVMRAAEHFEFVKLAQPIALYRVHPLQTSLKLTPINYEFILRNRALQRLRQIGGHLPQRRDVRRRQFRALFNYGLAQYRAGLYKESFPNLLHALKYQPSSGRAMAYVLAACFRSISVRK